jgi:AraC-like DNA-binding protein
MTVGTDGTAANDGAGAAAPGPPMWKRGWRPRWNDGPGFAPDIVAVDVSDDRFPLERLLAHVSCTVHRAGWVPCWPAWSQPEHVHPWYVAYLCVAGGADYVVGGVPYRVDPGDLLLLPPHVPRSGRHDPAHPFQLYSVHFSARIYGVVDLPVLYGLPVLRRPAPEVAAQLADLVRRMVEELAAGPLGCLLAANGYGAAFLALLVRDAMGGGAAAGGGGAHAEGEGARRTAEVARLAPVFRLIERRYAQRLTLEELAASVHLHPAYFSTVFRRVTNVPPLQYVARYRLNRVRELLLSTDLPVSAIAADTGFRDPSYLDRVFRRQEGLSPTAYRKAKANPSPP